VTARTKNVVGETAVTAGFFHSLSPRILDGWKSGGIMPESITVELPIYLALLAF
jgi:hypothetical protein